LSAVREVHVTRASRLLAVAALLALAAGCGQKPHAIVLENPPARVESLDAVAIPTAIVKDEDGEPLKEQPELAWTVKPEGILQLAGGQMTPIKSGDVTVTVALKEGELNKTHKITVQLVDRIKLTCEPETCKFAPGATFRLRAQALSSGKPVEGVQFEWTTDAERIVKVKGNGEFEAVAPGTAKVQAMARGIAAGHNVMVVSPVEQLLVICPDPPFAEVAPSASTGDKVSCVVGVGESLPLAAEVRGGGEVMDRRVAWKSTNPSFVQVSGGMLQGAAAGAAIVEARVENLFVSLQVETRAGARAKCSTKYSERHILGGDEPQTFACGGADAVRCLEKAAAKKSSAAALSGAAKKCCCAKIPTLPPKPEKKAPEPEGDKPEGDKPTE
jgi:hypothetical protein